MAGTAPLATPGSGGVSGMPMRRSPHAPRPPSQTSPACSWSRGPRSCTHSSTAPACPAASPDQRLIGTVYAGICQHAFLHRHREWVEAHVPQNRMKTGCAVAGQRDTWRDNTRQTTGGDKTHCATTFRRTLDCPHTHYARVRCPWLRRRGRPVHHGPLWWVWRMVLSRAYRRRGGGDADSPHWSRLERPRLLSRHLRSLPASAPADPPLVSRAAGGTGERSARR
jgi:hypothetical protein